MAQLPGGAFAKGRDRIVRIADPGGTRLSPASDGSGIISGAYTSPAAATMLNFKGLTQAEFSPSPTSQEFFLLGDNGYRDSVGVTQAGELACTSFFINSLNGSGAAQGDIDPTLTLVLNAESDPDVEIYVEMLTLLGQDASSNFLYFVRAFQACVTDVSEAAPSDGLIEYSWTFQSRGEIFVGTLNNSTSEIDIYA
jgi:hypothetical protein